MPRYNTCRFFYAAVTGWLLLLGCSTTARALATDAIPADLEPWSGWVVRDVEDFGCPIRYNADSRRCGYPGSLELELDSRGGSFKQGWRVFRATTVPLPGDPGHWPLEVTVDDAPVVVMDRGGRPALTLDSGRHVIQGRFRWQQLPAALVVPPESGLVALQLDGRMVERPDIRNDQLWLSDSRPQADSARRADIRVYRMITDSVPLTLSTRIELDVSGDQRELALDGALLRGFQPVALDSHLPARLDAGGRLVLKLRAGRWVVNVDSRLNRETLALELDRFPAPWPADELWVFSAQPQLRLLKVTSPDSIDASQSTLPREWQSLPAYRLQAGTGMTFELIRRGDPDPEPDQLELVRELWLDFDGKGYSVSDHISGTLSRSWRINSGAGLLPGQVTLHGQPQLITRADNGAVGVEVRQGNIVLAADSRIEDSVRHLSAVGWDHDFNRVSATINVPPGYRVFAISGADRATATWLSRWTLLDFFIVLISSIALAKLYGLRWGVLGLVALVALWHEPGAPAYIWLNLIATLALMRTVRDTRIYPLVRNYLVLSSVALLLLALPFMVEQVRAGIYPQLEYAWQSMGDAAPRQPATPPPTVAERKSGLGSVPESLTDSVVSMLPESDRPAESHKRAPGRLAQDPGARLQTGPGLPQWSWRSYPLAWNGPVQKDQPLTVYLISPPLNLLLNLFRVAMVLLLAWKLVRAPARELLAQAAPAAGNVAVAVLLCAGMLCVPDPARADFPSQELLTELRQHLLEPADCLPDCAQLEQLAIRLDPERAQFTLRIHAAENLALPLPVPLHEWMPSEVLVDGVPADALFRDSSARLWLYVDAGVHEVSVQGRVAQLRALRLDLPLPPRALALTLDGWSRDGADTPVAVPQSLSFTREQVDSGTASFDTRSEIPVFAHVTRRLGLGLDWRVDTTVQLVSGTALPSVLRIPLLDGEAVMTDTVKVEEGYAVVSLGESSRTVSWQSSLAQSEQLTLATAAEQTWAEQWNVEVAPIWRVSFSGIPVVYHQQGDGLWHPQWRPWPGEQVQLSISRPQAIAGITLTIDRSKLVLTPGKRATTAELAFTLRSSQGQQHNVQLPEGAALEWVRIDGKAVPIRQDGRSVNLPLHPGSQDIALQWQEPRGIGWHFTTPALDLGVPSVNAGMVIRPGNDRWVLLTGGVRQGPAVLFWGVLIVVVLIALALGRVRGIPLHTGSWILLGIGLSTVTPFSALLIAAWIFALYARGRGYVPGQPVRFNLMQIALVLLTLFALAALFGAVSNGLLGNPAMQIAGNGSAHGHLNWYQDRIGNAMPQPWLVSVPVLVYRFLMLAWSMWMAFALIRWLKWGWGCFAQERLWMPVRTA